MERIIAELLAQSLNGVSSSVQGGGRPNRRDEPEEDLRSFIRPTDTFEHNIQLLQLIQSIENARYAYDVKRRQLRIVSDMMEDYQHNMQLFLQTVNLATRNEFLQSRPAPYSNRARQPAFEPARNTSSSSGLTDRQVELATRTLVYDASMNEPRCPISLEDFTAGEEIVQIIGCGHYFKCGALREWFRRNTQCPVCRYSVTTPTGRVRSVFSTPNLTTRTEATAEATATATTSVTDTWTSILSGLLTSPENTRLYTVEQEIVLPLTFDHAEEVD